MSCEICERNSCCSSFHSIDEQVEFDKVADKVKDRMRASLASSVQHLDGHHHGDNYYVRLEDVLETIKDYS